MSWSVSASPLGLYELAELNGLSLVNVSDHISAMNPALTVSTLPLNPPVNQGLVCSLDAHAASDDHDHDGCPTPEPCQDEQTGTCSKQQIAVLDPSSFEDALQQSLLLMIEALPASPDRILFVGGCRMPAMARFLALQLPQSRITLADADPAWVARAKADIGCRCAFITIDPLALPFEADRFQLTLVFNSMAAIAEDAVKSAPLARWMSQLARVTQGQIIWGELQSGFLFKMLGQRLPDMPETLARWGIEDPLVVRAPRLDTLMQLLFRYGRVQQRLMPYPWRVFRAELHAIREDRLILAV